MAILGKKKLLTVVTLKIDYMYIFTLFCSNIREGVGNTIQILLRKHPYHINVNFQTICLALTHKSLV